MSLPVVLKPKKVLLIGAGKVAKHKAKILAQNSIKFKVVAQDVIENFGFDVKIKKFKYKDTKGFDVVIDATGNKKVTKKLLKKKRFLLNVVNKPKLCDFYFGSIAKNKNIKVLISSNATSPRLTQVLRDRIQKIIPTNIDVDRILEYKDIYKKSSKLFLIGCGAGDVELLTIKAYKTISILDVALYDHLVNDEILNLLPKGCKKIFVGKEKNKHYKTQDEINKLILKYTKKGKIVGRLKGGHPYLFARGYEEYLEATKVGVDVEVIEGLSSAFSAPTSANIPITFRDNKDSVLIVSAHLKNNRVNLNWVKSLKNNNLRIIVLMGISRSKEIANKAKELNIDLNKKLTIISNATLKNQKVVTTTLKELPTIAKSIEKPAIMVF